MSAFFQFPCRTVKSIARPLLGAPGLALVLALALSATSSHGQTPSRTIRFTGYVDADVTTSFAGGGVKDPAYLTGLEVDLTTTVTFNPRLSAALYTTMNDGVVPAQGAGNTWSSVRFDGAALNWKYSDATMIHVGDIIQGTGYFNYYLHKRSAMVVGEHALRGAGFTRKGLTIATGATDLGATDLAGNPTATSHWATFFKYDITFGPNVTLTPSAKYTAGVPGATPAIGGLSFDGRFGGFKLGVDIAVNYYNSDYDPGATLLLEPSFSQGSFSVSSALFVNAKGQAPRMAPNYPSQTLTGREFDDMFVYVEPAYAFSKTYAFGLPIEFHDASGNNLASLGYDQSVWVVPTLYIYPGSGVEWRIWAQVVKPTTIPPGWTNSDAPQYFAGSEIIFKF